jgi:hypothetical protein
MGRFLPVVWFALTALAVLMLAGLGAAGNWRGAMRYVKIWAVLTLALVLVALLLSAILS